MTGTWRGLWGRLYAPLLALALDLLVVLMALRTGPRLKLKLETESTPCASCGGQGTGVQTISHCEHI